MVWQNLVNLQMRLGTLQGWNQLYQHQTRGALLGRCGIPVRAGAEGAHWGWGFGGTPGTLLLRSSVIPLCRPYGFHLSRILLYSGSWAGTAGTEMGDGMETGLGDLSCLP